MNSNFRYLDNILKKLVCKLNQFMKFFKKNMIEKYLVEIRIYADNLKKLEWSIIDGKVDKNIFSIADIFEKKIGNEKWRDSWRVIIIHYHKRALYAENDDLVLVKKYCLDELDKLLEKIENEINI